MSNSEDYTIGWICAIATEYVAAQAFLDREHDRSEEYGISSAATAAKDMYATQLSQYQNWSDGRYRQRCTKSNARSTYILPRLRAVLEAVDESRCGKHVTVKRCANNSNNET